MFLGDNQVAIAAVAAGAETICQISNDISDTQHIIKGPRDFATQADITSKKEIIAIIKHKRPQDDIVAEESGLHTAAIRSNTQQWLVDPLCGTVNYAAHTQDVAVNVALQDAESGKILSAAVAHPFSGKIFWTDAVSAHIRKSGTDYMLTQQRPSPGLPLAKVAAGKRAAYISEGDIKDNVHYASGIAICQSAGCVVTGIDGQPLHTGAGGLLITEDQPTHAALLAILKDISS
ncbi:Inositol monophosphatase [Metarhizium guizhouense ARSEF 977]|uniref:Inositol monophosphatase n=1 Tax=Metarhizium guizhouense (strain ARSEF 977) TaxID=1276136 RepID=A0A0B4GQK3_METGA|nr:Inositol monophosphatase [Metarhizium guizhouense ARSEF 977]